MIVTVICKETVKYNMSHFSYFIISAFLSEVAPSSKRLNLKFLAY